MYASPYAVRSLRNSGLLAAFLLGSVVLAACGSKATLQGRYADQNDMFSLDFQSDGKVKVGGAGGDMLTDYQVSGQNVTITTPKGSRTLTLVDDDTLQMPDATKLMRERAYACKDSDGEIGTLMLEPSGEVLLKAPGGGAPETLGRYSEDATSVTITESDGSSVYSKEGRDLKADKVSCKRI